MLPFQSIQRRQGVVAPVLLSILVLVILGANRMSIAAPVSRDHALQTAYAWLSLSPEAMHEHHGQLAGTVTPVPDAVGATEFYAVDLKPAGFVIVAADDGVEPIIAFSSSDSFQAAPGNPLFEMLRADLPARISRVDAAHPAPSGKWRILRAIADAPKVLTQDSMVYTAGSASTVSDVRVSPLIKSKWDQLTYEGLPVYNYFTPPHAAGSTSNYYTGCVATMLGQIMRFHQWPQTGVGSSAYQITVNNNSQQRSLRGGDGAGGSYPWADMPLQASSNMPANEEQAISALLSDAGVASNMDYEPSGSGASIKASVLTDVFHYANAAFSSSGLSSLEVAIKANLDAGLPVGLGVSGNGVGHAVVADGYGYNATTLYHHLNMGWSGANNAWYNLPTINVGFYDFTVVNGAIYNIDPLVKGEIVSGRIVDGMGAPVVGAPVTVSSGSVIYTATTSTAGVYAVKGLSSNTTWIITPDPGSWEFTPASLIVTTGHSSANGSVGDKTGEDFTSRRETGTVSVQINSGAVAAGAVWRVDGGAWLASGASDSGVPIGKHTVSFHAATGWATPAAYSVTVADGQTTSVTTDYDPKYSLTAVPDNAADGQVVANPAPGQMGSYAENTNVVLTATAAAGYYFGGWLESGTLVSTAATYSVVIKGARNLVGSFPPVSLTGQNTQVYITTNKGAATINVLSDLNTTAGTVSILGVTQPTNGVVTINTDGTLTFTPGKGFHGSTQFSYSAGDGQGGSITKVVTISNWFAASAGTYAGLSLASAVTNEASGYLKAAVTSSGAFSGKLTAAGISYSLKGAFDVDANYQKTIPRKGESELQVGLHLDAASEITGTVSDGVTASDLIANRVTFSAKNKATQAGRYTALLTGASVVPGDGYLIVTITPTGRATATGRLADGTPVSTGAYVNADGTVPYYAGIYKSGTSAGSVLGTMLFQPNTSPECTGEYAWFRPASTTTYYPAGFEVSGTISGSLLPPPPKPSLLKGAQATLITAELSGGGLASQIDETGQLLDDGKTIWNTPNAVTLTLTASSTGIVTGFFIDPSTDKKREVLGVWLPKLQIGGGFFLGDSSAGGLTLSTQ
jgi:hypothetical protein